MTLLLIIVILIAIAVVVQYIELQKFTADHFTVESEKVRTSFRLVVFADLHGHAFGKNNSRLIEQTKKARPDYILTAGDMITAKETGRYGEVLDFMIRLREIAPVYYGMGNHEGRVKMPESSCYEDYLEYEAGLKAEGIHVLDNEKAEISNSSESESCTSSESESGSTAGEDTVLLYGLTLPVSCYEKREPVPLSEEYIVEQLGRGEPEKFQILLAHSPAYCEQYAKWGSDLTFCGHNHGGLIRIPGVGSVFSPQFEWFPKYDRGHYLLQGKDSAEKKHVIVSAGLGTHTFHIRIFNRAQLLVVDVCPKRR